MIKLLDLEVMHFLDSILWMRALDGTRLPFPSHHIIFCLLNCHRVSDSDKFITILMNCTRPNCFTSLNSYIVSYLCVHESQSIESDQIGNIQQPHRLCVAINICLRVFIIKYKCQNISYLVYEMAISIQSILNTNQRQVYCCTTIKQIVNLNISGVGDERDDVVDTSNKSRRKCLCDPRIFALV